MSEHGNVLAVARFEDALRDHLDAIDARDADAFERTLHDDVRLVGPGGSIIEGRSEAAQAHRTWFAEDDWRFDPAVIWREERAGAAWALASVTYTSRGDASRFLLFLLFVSDGGSWKLLYDQNTPLA